MEYRLIIDQSGLHLGIHFMVVDGDFIHLLKHYGVVIFFKLVNFSIKFLVIFFRELRYLEIRKVRLYTYKSVKSG